MNRSNIEIKARVQDFPALQAKAQAIADGPCEVLQQRDVYFSCPTGRLKLRFLAPDYGELIQYERPDEHEAKLSRYRIAPTSEPAVLEAILTSVLPTLGVVSKTRLLAIKGQTRIHLDQVENLGAFLELEVVMRPDQSETEGRCIAESLMKQLDVTIDSLIDRSYIDLLLEHEATP